MALIFNDEVIVGVGGEDILLTVVGSYYYSKQICQQLIFTRTNNYADLHVQFHHRIKW